MELQEMITLIQTVSDSKLTEFCYEENGVKLRLKKKGSEPFLRGTAELEEAVPGAASESTGAAGDAGKDVCSASPSADAAGKSVAEGKLITSPMVGTFYSSPSEDADAFVSVGDSVKKGQVVGIVEAMKLMNEIESPYDGIVEEILAENKEMIGFGQALIRLR